jgi:hypothetical protein
MKSPIEYSPQKFPYFIEFKLFSKLIFLQFKNAHKGFSSNSTKNADSLSEIENISKYLILCQFKITIKKGDQKINVGLFYIF